MLLAEIDSNAKSLQWSICKQHILSELLPGRRDLLYIQTARSAVSKVLSQEIEQCVFRAVLSDLKELMPCIS